MASLLDLCRVPAEVLTRHGCYMCDGRQETKVSEVSNLLRSDDKKMPELALPSVLPNSKVHSLTAAEEIKLHLF